MKKLKPFVLIAIFIGIPSLCVFGQNTNNDILIKSYEKLTGDVLKSFKQDYDDLMAMQTSDRQLKTKLWLKLLDQIDQTRDWNFDFNNPSNTVSANVAPPPDAVNPRSLYPAGTDPSSIKEPEIRQAFEKVIQENHEKYLRIDFELQLKRFSEDSTTSAVRYFDSVYAKTSADASELAGYLEILSNEKHKAEIKDKLKDLLNKAQ